MGMAQQASGRMKPLLILLLITVIIPAAQAITLAQLLSFYHFFYDSGNITIGGITHYATNASHPFLNDTLNLNLTLAVTEDANYTFLAAIKGTPLYATARVSLPPGTHTLSLAFGPETLANASYNLSLQIEKNNGLVYDNATAYAFNFSTQGYAGPKVALANVTHHFADTDANPKDDTLILALTLDSSLAATQELAAFFAEDSSVIITRINASLTPGLNNLTLSLSTDAIRTKHMESLTLYQLQLGSLTLPQNYTIADYSLSALQSNVSLISKLAQQSPLSDTGIPSLDVDVTIESAEPDTYALTADLYDAYGAYIYTLAAEDILEAGAPSLTLEIDGRALYQEKANGPYQLRNLRLIQGGEVIDFLANPLNTSPYTWNQFLAPPLPDLAAVIIPQNSTTAIITTSNTGTAPAFLTTINVYLNDTSLQSSTITLLLPNQSHNLSVQADNLTTLYALIDLSNSIDESDEENNLAALPLPEQDITTTLNTTINATINITINAMQRHFHINSSNRDTIQSIDIPGTIPANESIILNLSMVKDGTSVTLGINNLTIRRQINDTTSHTLIIPANAIITGTSGWDGTILFPAVRALPGAGINGTAELIIELGDTQGMLNLSGAAIITLAGMAGKAAGYVAKGQFHPIPPCNATQAAEPDTLPPAGDCSYNQTSGLIIATKHFTEFIAYTASPAPKYPAGSSQDDGGGGSDRNLTIPDLAKQAGCFNRWECQPWSACEAGMQYRSCAYKGDCEERSPAPIVEQPCLIQQAQEKGGEAAGFLTQQGGDGFSTQPAGKGNAITGMFINALSEGKNPLIGVLIIAIIMAVGILGYRYASKRNH